MMYTASVATLIAALATKVFGDTQPIKIHGNYYTNAIDSIVYTNWGTPGTYQAVTYIDSATGQCDKSPPISYEGGMAPLDKEVM